MVNQLEKRIARKFWEFDEKLKDSFNHIKQDIFDMKEEISEMNVILKKTKESFERDKEKEKKIRKEFCEEVDDVRQKKNQLGLALSEVKAIQKEVVVMRDLAKIEKRIKQSFKDEVDSLKNVVKDFQKGFKKYGKRLKKLEKRVGKIEKKV